MIVSREKTPMTAALIISLLVFLLSLSGCGKTHLTEAEHLQRAKSYQAKGELNAAIIELKNTLQQNANNREARLLLGRQYLVVGDGPSAEKELRRALKLGAPPEKISALLAQALLLQGKYQQLLREFKPGEASDPDERATILVVQGEALLSLRKEKKAAALLAEAAKIQPDNAVVKLGLAKLAVFQGAIKRAAVLAGQAAAADPGLLEAANLQGLLALQQRHYDEAGQAYQAVLKRVPKNPLSMTELEARIGLVRLQLAQKNYPQAQQAISYLLKHAPGHPIPQYYQGLLAYQQKHIDVAQDYLQRVLKRLPGHLPSLLLMGSVDYAKGNYEQAASYLSRYLGKNPASLQAQKLLAAVQMKLKQPGMAVKTLEDSARKSGDAQLLAMVGQAAVLGGDIEKGKSLLKKAVAASPDEPAIRATLAKVYMQGGEYDQAIKELGKISGGHAKQAKILMVIAHLRKKEFSQARKLAVSLAKQSPDDPALQTLAGGVFLVAKDTQAARDYFNKAIGLDKRFIPPRLNLARMALAEKNLSGARKQLQDVLSIDPRNLAAMLAMAKIAEQQGNLNKALAWVKKAQTARPEALLPHLMLGRYYLQTGDVKNALDTARQAAATLQGDNSAVLILLGQAQLRSGKTEAALESYQKLVDKFPQNPTVYFDLANVQVILKRFGEAKAALEQALKLKPDYLRARAALVQVEFQAGHKGAALKLAREIQKKYAKLPLGYMLAGDIRFSEQKYRQAQQAYQKALKKQPSAVLVNKLAMAYQQAHEDKKAVGVLQSWLKKHPDDQSMRLRLALFYQQMGTPEEAVIQYQRMLKKNSENVVVLNNLALLSLKDQPDKALAYAEQAHRLAPESPAVGDTLGWILVQQGRDVARGVKLLRKAADQASRVAEIRYHLAAGLAKTGQNAEAKKLLKALLASGKPFEGRKAAEQLLIRL